MLVIWEVLRTGWEGVPRSMETIWTFLQSRARTSLERRRRIWLEAYILTRLMRCRFIRNDLTTNTREKYQHSHDRMTRTCDDEADTP